MSSFAITPSAPITFQIKTGSYATIANQAGSASPILVVWRTAAGVQTSTIPAGSSLDVVPSDGSVTLAVASNSATAQVTARGMTGGSIVGVPATDEPSAVHLRTASFTRPNDTTAYAANDLIANSTTTGSVVPLTFAPPASNPTGGSGCIRRVRFRKSNPTGTLDVRLHLYSAPPTLAAGGGDNAPWSTNGSSTWIGAVDIYGRTAFTDGYAGIGVPNEGLEIPILPGQTIFGLIRTPFTYTPLALETFELTLEVSPWGA